MNSSKKPRMECELFCQFCQHLDEENEVLESVILTDPRLNQLYDNLSDTPQHRITHFTIHDSDRRFCWFDSKPIEDGYQLFLCGYVLPIVSICDSDTDGHKQNMSDDSPLLAQMIGPLEEWWFAGFDGGSKLIVGVETQFASYILCEPNDDYMDLFAKCTQNMFITKLIIESLLKNPDSSYEDLVSSIERNEGHICEEQIMLFSSFIVEQIKSFDSAAEEGDHLLSETHAFKTLVELSGIRCHSKRLATKKSHISHVRPIARIDARRAINSDTITCSTPLVTQFFDSLFKDVIECEANSQNMDLFGSSTIKTTCPMRIIESNKKINWIGSSVYEDRFARTTYYSSVKINELTYTCGQFVVHKDSQNSLALGRIMHMFSTCDKQNMCHILYFWGGKDTILGETAPNRFVFMTNKCDNIEIETIENKIDILLTNNLELNSEEYRCGPQNTYFCTKLYTEKCGRFEDLPPEAFDSNLKCISCLHKETNERLKIPLLSQQIINESNDSDLKTYKTMIYKNQNYSIGDCALFSSDVFDINYFNYESNKQMSDSNDNEYDDILYPERYRKQFTDYIKRMNNDLPKTLNIGLIKQISKQGSDSNEETKLLVNIFYRPQNIYQDYSEFRFYDLNVLFWSNHETIIGVNSLRDKCRVIYSKKSPETDFYIETKLFYFNQCFDFERKTFLEPNEELINRFTSNEDQTTNDTTSGRPQFKVMDLFAGCGALSYGFEKLGLVSELWAFEKDYSAVQSFKTNFKSAHVFQEDVNHVLDQLIKGVKCDKGGQLFPLKGQIDLILGGPPCQGFSGMNRFSSRNYSLFKNSLVVSFLSFVDFYRPKYFLFENVRNFALFKNSMILKLMLSCLLSMGYQCHFAILQSGSYGLPQTRRRFVIIGASTGFQLPSFPEPTHVFSKRQTQLSISIDNRRYLALSKKSGAQFRTITVDDAITDLPDLNEDYTSTEVRRYRLSDHTTHYQRIMRQNCDHNLFDHFCKELSQLCRLRIQNIPQRLDSDWRDLPNISYTLKDGTLVPTLKYCFKDLKNGSSKSNQLRGVCICAQGLPCNANQCKQENTLIPWCLVHTANRQYHWSGLYGRLALNGYFPTTVTNPEPISKQGRVLHPNQDRIISIRESARSQGFPDHFKLCGIVSDKYRQIGNAVPIPLSFALSRQFLSIV